MTVNLRYPEQSFTPNDSKITFSLYKVRGSNVNVTMKANNTFDEFGGTDVAIQEALRRQQANEVAASSKGGVEVTGDQVSMYLPIGFTQTDNFNYDTPSLGVGGAAAAQAIQAGRGLSGSLMDAVKQGGASLVDFFGGITGRELGRAATARAVAAMPLVPDNVKAGISIAAGVSVNPNIRVQFNGVGLREFTFAFKLIPTTPKESADIKEIIKFFRINAYPEEIPIVEGGPAVAYNYPNMFKIRLLSGNSGKFEQVGTPIKLCYLRSVTHTYNATSQVFMNDGAPSEVDLSLSFMEYKTLSRKDIENEEKGDAFYDYEL